VALERREGDRELVDGAALEGQLFSVCVEVGEAPALVEFLATHLHEVLGQVDP
jgi:hypothetical protein